jgi:hypothetical protein
MRQLITLEPSYPLFCAVNFDLTTSITRRPGSRWLAAPQNIDFYITCIYFFFCRPKLILRGPGISVIIVTDYGLEGPGIESRWGRDFPRLSRLTLGPVQPPVQWVPYLSRGLKCGWGVLLTTHTLLAPRSLKSRAIPLPTLWATPSL